MPKWLKLSFLCICMVFTVNNAQASEFSDTKLVLMCELFSADVGECNSEIEYLQSKNKKNSIVEYCYSKYKNIKSFKDCLKYEQNPIVFLKYQNNKTITSKKIFQIKDQIILKCQGFKNLTEKSNCIKDNYITLEKSKDTKNWIENHCVYSNTNLRLVNKCINKIKKESMQDNELLNSVREINNVVSSWEKQFNTKTSGYIKQVYKACATKYTDYNAYECLESQVSPYVKVMTEFSLKDTLCFKYDNFIDFENCLGDKKPK